MNKCEFLDSLRNQLGALPKNEQDKWLSFYSEIIDDHVEDGQTEEEAVASLGSVVVTASSILNEFNNELSGCNAMAEEADPSTGAIIIDVKKTYESDVPPKKKSSWGRKVVFWSTIPIWGSILITVLALLFSVWISAAAIVASLWVTTAALAICAPLSVGFILFMITTGSIPSVLFNIGTTLALFGLAILLFYASYEVSALFKRWTIWLWNLTKRLVRWVFSLSKKSISKKEIVTSNSEYPTEGVPVTA